MKFVKILAALTGFVAGITAVSAQAQVTVTKEGTARSTGSISNVTDDDIIDWVIQIENIGAADLSHVPSAGRGQRSCVASDQQLG
ncbi:hypothetical protein N9O95_04980 [Alphaproteobacteria bacterium]|nr:hypothetical protein [Alphaproteobacteria bacterium]